MDIKPDVTNGSSLPPRSPLVFVHIPKTAGTSLLAILHRIYGPRSMYVCEQSYGSIETFTAMPVRQRLCYRVLAGHFNFGLRVLYPGLAAVMTFLRDPVERVLSLYSYVRTAPAHPLYQRARLPDFTLRTMYDEHQIGDNGQVRFLARETRANRRTPCTRAMLDEAKQNLAQGCLTFGLAERFADSLELFSRVLDWPRLPAVRFNMTRGRVSRDQTSAPDLELIDETNRFDTELYAFASRLFEERLRKTAV